MPSTALQVMDLTSLRAVLSELRQELLPSRFEKAQQPDAHTIQLGLRTLKGMVWLELSWRADAPRLVQIPSPSHQGSGSTLAQQIQHGLRQLALIELNQQGFDRVVEFGLASRPGEPIQRTLVLELMGRHSNLLLLDDQRRVITLGRQVREHQSRVRPISTGDLYGTPPPLLGLKPQLQESRTRWQQRLCLVPTNLRKALQQCYQGISPALALQLANDDITTGQDLLDQPVHELSDECWHQLHQRWCQWLKQLEQDQFTLRFEGPTAYRVWNANTDSNAEGTSQDISEGNSEQKTEPQKETGNSANQLANPSLSEKTRNLSLPLGIYYRKQLDAKAFHQLAKDLQNKLNNQRQREQQAIGEQQRRLDDSSASRSLQQQADELLCQPSPSKELITQAQKLYGQAKKQRRSVSALKQRLEHHQLRLELINGSESFLEDLLISNNESHGQRLIRLQELAQELDDCLGRSKRQRQPTKSTRQKQSPTPLEIKSPGGLLIQVGRNHRQNEWISLRQASPGDLWFHAQECPGSHVVLKASTGFADEADQQLAADLAAHFSRAKGNQHVAVMMVPVEQLQRIAGAGPGTVRFKGGTICWAVPERGLEHLNLTARELLA